MFKITSEEKQMILKRRKVKAKEKKNKISKKIFKAINYIPQNLDEFIIEGDDPVFIKCMSDQGVNDVTMGKKLFSYLKKKNISFTKRSVRSLTMSKKDFNKVFNF